MKKLFLLILLGGLLLCVCAVGAATVGRRYLDNYLTAELPDECPEIAVTQEAAISFVNKILVSGQGAVEAKRTRITITQEELTSFVAIGALLAEQAQELQNLQNLQNLSPEQTEQLRALENMQGMERLQTLKEFSEQQRESGDVGGPGGLPVPDLSLRLTLEEPQICFKESGQIAVEGYASVRDRRQPVRLIVAPRASQGELVLDFVEGDLGPVPLPESLFDIIGTGLARTILAGQEYAEISEITVGGGRLTIAGRLNR